MPQISSGGAFVYTLTIGICAGVGLALTFNMPLLYIGVILAFCVVFVFVGFAWRVQQVFIVAAFLAALAFGMIRADIFQFNESRQNLLSFSGTAVVQGIVVNDPEVSGNYLHANIKVFSVNGSSANGILLGFFSPNTTLKYGEKVEVEGKLQAPASFVGDAGNIFDYPGYLRVQGVSMLLRSAQINSAEPASLSIIGALFNIKHAFDASIEGVIPEPDASLLEGILLGERHGLPATLEQAFVLAGLIHIVILSGYSMSVVSEGVLRGLAFLPKTFQYVLGALAMILFVIMTGAAATTVRASAMALVALAARYAHRQSIALRSLAVVAFAMVLWNPPMLLQDVSFIVSILATFGLIAFSPSIEASLIKIIPKFTSLVSIITSTIAVQIFALPALLYFTGNFSFISVPANLLVLPLLPFVMIGGLLTGLLGFVGYIFALVPAIITDLLLKWVLLIVAIVQLLPFSAAQINSFPLLLTLVLYVPLTALAIYLLRRNAAPSKPLRSL